MSNNIREREDGGVNLSEILEVRKISVSFGRLQALMDVSLSVDEGEIIGVIGPNGAGKTALLNCINGIYTPDSGEILFEGRPITRVPKHEMLPLGIGRTFQHAELFRELSVIENTLIGRHAYMKVNVFSGGVFWGPGRREELKAREKAEEVLDFLDLYPYRKEKVGNLSFGIQKIVGLARALAGEPRLLLIDEIGSGLMRQEKEDVAKFILRIHYELGTAIIWIEHDMQMVTDICNRLICLVSGEKIKEGEPPEVISDPKVIGAYVGRGISGNGTGS